MLTLNTKISLRYDTYEQWHNNNPVLLKGELGIVEVPNSTGIAQNEPTYLLKVGNGTDHFNDLKWISGTAADVYNWAKQAQKPTYNANEIINLEDFVNSTVQDTNTKYQIVQNGNLRFKLQSKELNSNSWVDVSDITLIAPTYTHPSTHDHSMITGMTANRALVSDSAGRLAESTVTSTELGYLDGVTSNVQTQLNGKAASSHGTHVIFSSIAPKVAGTASVGSATTVARSDHVHPAQTSVSGNAGTATKLATSRTIQTNLGSTSAASFNGSANITPGVTGVLEIGNGGTGNTYGLIQVNLKTGTTPGYHATIEGSDNTGTGPSAHAEGTQTVASGYASHAEGVRTTASGPYSHAEGGETVASEFYTHAEGFQTQAKGTYAHAEGKNTIAQGYASHAEGEGTTAGLHQHASGRFSIASSAPSDAWSMEGSLFIIGNGKETAKKNAFRVATNGTVYGSGAYNSSGADYAEMFEWTDGNPNNEDRRGLFVTLEAEKIRIANESDDYILGVISATPAILGDSFFGDVWHGMYKVDPFGAYILETVHIEEEIKEIVPAIKDNEGSIISEAITQIIPAHDTKCYVLNPEYDALQEYESRESRQEWSPVGMLGKLVVIDDGTCEVNGYCKVLDQSGKATKSETSGYRVMRRIDDTHIQILFR